MSELELYREQIEFARNYSKKLIDSIPESNWFWETDPQVTHVAWQVGHLAMAQYRMVIERVRGSRPEDGTIIPPEFIELFARGSVVQPESAYPPVADIRRVFDAVHRMVIEAMSQLAERDLRSSPAMTSHAFCKTKADCLAWCSAHEMVHAGQIGLLRRLMGLPALW